jgi:hypothetical protein
MCASTKNLKQEIQSGKIDSTKFDDVQLNASMKEKERIPGYTWHHHQDTGRMQLIPKELHDKTGHVGGSKMWGYK